LDACVTDWAVLRHAYGTAEDVSDLLAAAEESGTDFAPAWEEVWSRLCHQGTVYTASYAALPLLTAIAERHAPAGYIAALDLASDIVASTDGPLDSAEVRSQWAAALGRLQELAQHNLPLAAGDAEFVYGLQALLAFQNGGVWQRRLDHVADGELPLECPRCDEFLLLNLEGPEYLLTNCSDASAAPTPVHPVEPSADSTEGRILATSKSLGRTMVAAKLTYAFGALVCPSCATSFHAAHAFA
jgi:hypothetical protein